MIGKKSIAIVLLACAFQVSAKIHHHQRGNSYGDDSNPGKADAMFDAYYMPKLESIAREFGKFSHQTYGLTSLNFGVLVNNKHHHIYRSKALGEKGSEELFTHLINNNLSLPSRVIFINKDGFRKKMWAKIPYVAQFIRGTDNFAMQESKLFHPAGRFPDVEFWHPLNNEVYLHGHNPLIDETEYLASNYTDNESSEAFAVERGSFIPARKENFYRILELVLSSEGPVLFHCTGGIHRTGMVGMAVRNLQGGVWTEEFAEPIRIVSYSNFSGGQEIILNNYAEVEYVMHNHYQVRLENFEAVRQLAQEDRFKQLYERYHEELAE